MKFVMGNWEGVIRWQFQREELVKLKKLNSRISSATSIRKSIDEGKNIKKHVPKETYKELKKSTPSQEVLFHYLKYKIISENNLQQYHSVDEGLESRIKKVIEKSNNLNELILNIKSKRYTYNRISRMLCHIFIGFTKTENKYYQKVNYIKVLGFNDIGRDIIKNLKEDSSIPIILRESKNTQKLTALNKRSDNTYLLLVNKTQKNQINKLTNKNHPLIM